MWNLAFIDKNSIFGYQDMGTKYGNRSQHGKSPVSIELPGSPFYYSAMNCNAQFSRNIS